MYSAICLEKKLEPGKLFRPEKLGKYQAVHVVLRHLRVEVNLFLNIGEGAAAIPAGTKEIGSFMTHPGNKLHVAVKPVLKRFPTAFNPDVVLLKNADGFSRITGGWAERRALILAPWAGMTLSM